MLSTHPKTSSNFSFKFILSAANVFNLDQSKILSFGKKLTKTQEVMDKCTGCLDIIGIKLHKINQSSFKPHPV